ncbi:type II toxin-antitoxin system Phd/YefM family antitoxin [Aerococcaceae bacterium WGS1372]
METIFYEEFERNLKAYMRQANEDVKTFIVTANYPKENIVVFSKKEYDSIMESVRDLFNNSTTD